MQGLIDHFTRQLIEGGMPIIGVKAVDTIDEYTSALPQRDRFDYTEWQRDLWADKSIEEISRLAMEKRLHDQ